MTELVALPVADRPRVDDAPVAGEPLRLVHITTVPLSLGFLKAQIRYAVAHGVQVTAISAPGEELEAFVRDCGVEVAAVAMARRITPVDDLRSVLRIARLLRTLRPHVVHAHTPKGGLLGMIAAYLARVPVRIYDLWGLPFTTAVGARRVLLRWTERVACAIAHEVHSVSDSLRDVAVTERLCAPEKIVVLLRGSGHGVDATGAFDPARVAHLRDDTRDRLGIPRDALVIGFVGRMVRDKGLVELTRAWSTLRDRFQSLHLLVVGRFEPQDPVPRDVTERLERDPRIHLAGWATDTASLYAAMDVVTLPTYREGFPNVPLEAAAMQLPVVATRVAGCVDAVVDGVTGALVNVRDADALGASLADYLSDPTLRRTHGKAGRERVLRDFRPEPLFEALSERYSQLASRRVRSLSHIRLAAE